MDNGHIFGGGERSCQFWAAVGSRDRARGSRRDLLGWQPPVAAFGRCIRATSMIFGERWPPRARPGGRGRCARRGAARLPPLLSRSRGAHMRPSLVPRSLGGWFCAAIAAVALSAGPADAQTPVKVGYLKEPFNINVVKLADFVDGKRRWRSSSCRSGSSPRSAGRCRRGDPVAAFGYRSRASSSMRASPTSRCSRASPRADRASPRARAWRSRAGATSRGAEVFGVPPNSFVELRLKASLRKAGVNPGQVTFAELPGCTVGQAHRLKNNDWTASPSGSRSMRRRRPMASAATRCSTSG